MEEGPQMTKDVSSIDEKKKRETPACVFWLVNTKGGKARSSSGYPKGRGKVTSVVS